MKFDERNKKKLKIPHFLFPWQLRQALSYRFHFFVISFHWMWMWQETLL